MKAAALFLTRQPQAAFYQITLYGSLAATGRGHLTDKVLASAFSAHPFELVWRPDEALPRHPNGMRFAAFAENGSLLEKWDVYSVGGGTLLDPEHERIEMPRAIYDLRTMVDVMRHTDETGESCWEYVFHREGPGIVAHLEETWRVMSAAMDRGLKQGGVLPGGLGISRKAHAFFRKGSLYGAHIRHHATVWAYALAVSEENAAGGEIVTAPTCGASGVLPAVLRYLKETLQCDHQEILRALATAGLIGNLVKHNASISGAEVGCQGEVGTACAMAAAAATQLYGGTVRQVEYAAEMGLEHHLGLTCDPVQGLVQIPCIERNAHAATRALSCCYFALLAGGEHKISFDEITTVMMETGHALPSLYRETAGGGIAEAYRRRKKP